MSDFKSGSEPRDEKGSGRVLRRRLSRRRMLQASALAGVGAAGLALVGCGDDDEEAATAPAAEAPAAEEAAATAGYTAATPSAVPPKSSKDTLVIAVGATPLGADYETSIGSLATIELAIHMGEGLLREGWQRYPFDEPPEGIGTDYISFNLDQAQPWMVESWESSEDFSSTTFHIRPGITSYNGNELTSADLQYKIDRVYGLQAIGAFFAGLLSLDASNPIEIIDKYTYKLNSTGPQYLLARLAAGNYWGSILDSTEAKKHATEDDPWAVDWAKTGNQSFAGYGITAFEPGNQVVLSANPNYWRGVPPIKKVVYKEIPSPSNRLAAIQSGEADIATELPAELWLQARDQEIQKPYAVISNQFVFAFMNVLDDRFKDPRTRQALNWATPRRDVVDSALGGLGQPWIPVMTSIYPGADASVVPWGDQSDYAAAKQLLDAAGQGNGFDITLDIDSSVPFYERIAVLLQDALSNIGVNVSINPEPNASYAGAVLGKQKTFAFWQDLAASSDPIYALYLSYHGVGAVHNFGQMDDPELNALLDKATALITLEERVAIAKDIQKRVVELAPRIWLAEPYFTNVQAKNLQGFRWHIALNTYFSDMYFT